MCRYGLTTYKPHYACFACRKAFRRRLRADQPHLGEGPDQPARCPQCGLLMADLGRDFKPPRKTDEKAWALLGKLWDVGVTFHSCGCGGPGYRPRDPWAYREFLRNTLEDYKLHLQRWKAGTPTTPRGMEEQREAVQSWQARIDRVQAELSG